MNPNDPRFAEIEDEHDEGALVQVPRQNIRHLEKKAKAAEEAEARAEAAERRLAMLQAGVNLDDPVGQLFADAYRGDLTPEAVKEAAKVYRGALRDDIEENETTTTEGTSTEPTLSEEELGSSAERDLAVGGAPAALDPQHQEDPRRVAIKKGRAVYEEGGTEEQAFSEAWSVLAEAAAQGDRRVILE